MTVQANTESKFFRMWSWQVTTIVMSMAALFLAPISEGRPEESILHANRNGALDMTPFEREFDRRRMASLFSKNQEERRLLVASCEELCKQCIEIDVYFHLSGYRVDKNNASSAWMIPHPTDEFRRYRDQLRNRTDNRVFPEVEPGRFSSVADIYPLIEANMELLNNLYANTPFRFRWVNNDPSTATVGIQNNFAFFYAGNSHRSNDYAAAMHQGDSRTLNVYLVYRICGHEVIWVDSNCQTIGAGTNPSYQLDGTADGVYLSYDTLKRGGLEHYSNGISLAHEAGHWLGLLHVFQSETFSEEAGNTELDPCDPINEINGDFVDDTAFLPEPSVKLYRCSPTYYEAEGEEIPNSCPNLPGVDPIFNIMNMVGDEDCHNDGHAQFTCGQVERMYKQWLLYRAHDNNNFECLPDEMMINLTISLEKDSFADVHAEISPLNSNRPVFNFKRDMDLTLFPKHAANKTRHLMFCVPEGDYVMGVTDVGRNGFEDGYFDLWVNGQEVHRVNGSFGSTECLRFNANGAAAETKNEVESPGADFGEPYHFDVEGQDATVSCFALDEPYYSEPILVRRGHVMKVNVSLENAIDGVCVNDVTKLEIGVAGNERISVFPSSESDSSYFPSRVTSCGGHSCVISFDLSRMQAIEGSENQAGTYNTTCTATIKLGFGEACTDFLKQGGIDCSVRTRHEVFSTAEGHVLFSLSSSSAALKTATTSFILSLLTVGISSLLLMP